MTDKLNHLITPKDPEAIKQMEAAITNLEEEVTRQYYLLGKSVCESVEQKANEINSLVDRLIEMKQELVLKSHNRICPQCLTLGAEKGQVCEACEENNSKKECCRGYDSTTD